MQFRWLYMCSNFYFVLFFLFFFILATCCPFGCLKRSNNNSNNNGNVHRMLNCKSLGNGSGTQDKKGKVETLATN